MRTPLTVLLLTTLAGCGGADKLTGGSSSSNRTSGADATAKTPGVSPAVAVVDPAHLPACDGAHDGWIAYVESTKALEACASGTWSPVSVQSAPATGGAPGTSTVATSGEEATAAALYADYRKSVFRVTTSCVPKSPYPSGCPANPQNPSVFLGSAFLCAPGTLCTNIHVATCVPSQCFDFGSLSVQATAGDTDTLDAGTSENPPFFTTKSSASFKLHPTFDVAKVPVSGVPAGAKVLPITDKPAGPATIQALMPVLSLSFPLGFQDLYTDLGRVNQPQIGECDQQGGVSGYGCPKALYAFSTTNQTDHGSSGSPLFDLTSGKVIGITSAGTDGANADYTWATDAYHINELTTAP